MGVCDAYVWMVAMTGCVCVCVERGRCVRGGRGCERPCKDGD